MKQIITYFKGVWSELKKVTWPTRTDVIAHTIIVIVSAGVAISVTFGIDAGLYKLVQIIIQSKS